MSINRRQMLKTLGAGAVATGLAGCVGGDGGDGGGLETTGVVIPQFGLWDTTGPWLVGRDQGFFEEEGLDVERIDAEGGGGNVRTVVAGDAQIGMATGIAGLMAAYREDTNVTIVSNEINQSSDLFWYGLAGETEAEGVEAVEGLSLGFSSPGSSTNMVSLTAAERYGGEAVSIGGPPDANAAVEGGEVDLAWSAGQFFFDGVQSGDYDLVFRGNDVDPFGNLSIRVNFVDGALLEDNPDIAESYFTAQQRALDYAYNNLDEAAEIWGNEIDNDDYDFLRSVIEESYPQEAMDLTAFQGIEDANQVAVDFDFIDEKLSQEELNELIDTTPVTGSDEF